MHKWSITFKQFCFFLKRSIHRRMVPDATETSDADAWWTNVKPMIPCQSRYTPRTRQDWPVLCNLWSPSLQNFIGIKERTRTSGFYYQKNKRKNKKLNSQKHLIWWEKKKKRLKKTKYSANMRPLSINYLIASCLTLYCHLLMRGSK